MGDDISAGFQHEENPVRRGNQLRISDEEERCNNHADEEEGDKQRQEPEVRPEDQKPDVLPHDPLVLFIIEIREEVVAEKKKGTEEEDDAVLVGDRTEERSKDERQTPLYDREMSEEQQASLKSSAQGKPLVNTLNPRV